MIKVMRKHAKYFYFLFFIVILSFIFWGIGGVDDTGQREVLAKVGEYEITSQEFWRLYERSSRFYREIYKDKYEEMMNNISRIVLVNETSESNISERDKAIMEYEAYNRKIENVRGKKKYLIAKADLGVDNISIEDDFVKIDGFEFKENQISKSEAILLVSKMMCAINKAPIQVIGSANDLDWNTLDQLYNVAQNRGKIMILDQVDREASDIAVVAYEPHTGIVDTDTGEITHSPKTNDDGQTSLL